jgi:recombinational DNA repair protein (RecF pathway)
MNIFPDGEESVITEFLTADLGRIYVHIQGAKKIHNKHRMMVTLFGFVIIDCVEGKRFYRCTGISEWKPVYGLLSDFSKQRKMVLRQTFSILQKLVPSGIPTPEIFSAYENYMTQILNREVSDEHVQILTLVIQLRILGILGYWNSDWSDDVLSINGKTFEYVVKNQKSVQKLIERILVDTQMHHKVEAH